VAGEHNFGGTVLVAIFVDYHKVLISISSLIAACIDIHVRAAAPCIQAVAAEIGTAELYAEQRGTHSSKTGECHSKGIYSGRPEETAADGQLNAY
jgi:hypothetical protein